MLIDSENTVILVTGGYGFIGSHFIEYLFDKYNHIKVVNMDAMYYCANENNISNKIRNNNRYIFVKGNICSFDLVNYIIYTYHVTHVIHFAAQSHVQNSFSDSLQYTKDNIVGTHTLLECCRQYGKIEKFIHISTDEVYGESMLQTNEQKKTEHSILCPTNPYAATKASAELIAQSYFHSFKFPIIITRSNNIYGKNQFPEKVIPKFIKQLRNNEKVTIQDDTCVRSFLHISDAVQGIFLILQNGNIGDIYNIGCDENMEYSILSLAKLLIQKIKKTTEFDKWITYIPNRPFNDKRYYISNSKLKKIGWKIHTLFENGLDNLLKNDI